MHSGLKLFYRPSNEIREDGFQFLLTHKLSVLGIFHIVISNLRHFTIMTILQVRVQTTIERVPSYFMVYSVLF